MNVHAVNEFAFTVWNLRQGAVVSRMIQLGTKLGLYEAMAGAGWITAADLAATAGIGARYAEEWLRSQAAAGLLEYDAGRFQLSDAGVAVLADEESSPFFAASAFIPIDERAVIDRLAAAFTGDTGFSYDAGGDEGVDELEGMNGPWARLLLPTVVVDAYAGLRDRLDKGAIVTDVGSGSGLAVASLARAFPNSTFRGLDPSLNAVRRSSVHVSGLPNATVEVGTAESIDAGSSDVVTAFDCLHDMAHPDRALAAMRAALATDGLLLVKEIKTRPTFESQQRNPMLAMMYGLSVTWCLPSGLSEPDGMALGNQGLDEARLREMAESAGFEFFAVHDLGDPVNLYYELRP